MFFNTFPWETFIESPHHSFVKLLCRGNREKGPFHRHSKYRAGQALEWCDSLVLLL